MYIVTGASGGLGRKVIEELVRREQCVVGLYGTNCPSTPWPTDTLYIRYELTTSSNIMAKLVSRMPQIKDEDIHLIHLAGITINASISKTTFAGIQQQFEVNCSGVLHLIRELWPQMKEKQFGRLIFVSSVVAHRPVFGALGYSITKSAMEGMVRGLLPEGIKNNILPFGIGLGYTEYGMIAQVPEAHQEALKKTIPMGRFGNFEEVMNSIDFLINTPYMAGQILPLNGGLHLV